jgi:transcriptional regulator with XRE-family HTH domain
MKTPGQLIRQHRTRCGWSQRELAALAETTQSKLSEYETERRLPSWIQLCRILAPMGVQPTVSSEPCDVSMHAATEARRLTFHEWFSDRGLTGPLNWEDVCLDDVVRPQLARSGLTEWDVGPLCHLVDGMDAVFVGPLALRMHGFDCVVTRVDIELYAEGDPTDLTVELARRLVRDSVQVWSLERGRYVRELSPTDLQELIRQTGGRLTMRTDETGTEVRFVLCQGRSPRSVETRLDVWHLRILALDEFDRELPWVKHVIRSWIGPDEGAWPAGPLMAGRRSKVR